MGKRMTKGELMEALKGLPDDTLIDVILPPHNGGFEFAPLESVRYDSENGTIWLQYDRTQSFHPADVKHLRIEPPEIVLKKY